MLITYYRAEKAMVVYLRKHAEWKVATEKAEMEKA